MTLSRKRAKELKRLRAAASDLWEDQREVLEHASLVVKEAGRQAANAGREEVAPRVRETYDHRVRPVVDLGVASGRAVAETAREKVQRDVLPAVSSALASALAVLEVSKDPRVREALSNVRKAGSQLGVKVGVLPPKPQPSPARYILIGLAIISSVGVAYAAWQTLRADDELWVSDDEAGDPVALSSARP